MHIRFLRILALACGLLAGPAFVGAQEASRRPFPNSKPGGGYIIERVGGTHAAMAVATTPRPAQGETIADPHTGYLIARLTDVADIHAVAGANWGPRWAPDGKSGAGFYNGYARWTNVNATGEYLIAFRTDNHSCLYKTDGTWMGPVTPDRNHAIGESAEIRWDRSGRPGAATRIFYHFDGRFYQQDVLQGYASAELIHDLSRVGIQSTGDMDGSDDARYWALRLRNGKCVVLDAYERKLLDGQITQSPNGLDVSPSGKWFVVVASSPIPEHQFRFYRIADLAAGDTSRPVYLPTASAGHNGWAYTKAGHEALVYQDNTTDWFCAFDPETRENIRMAPLAELGPHANNHIGRMPKSRPGWALFSTYTGLHDSWAYNQLFMIEVAPAESRPRIWRLGSTWNAYTGKYFSEAFASIDTAGQHVYWASNWLGSDNLEIYRLTLPANWITEIEPRDGTP
ncbi:MAG: hypothetical protein M1457_14425 [bacterium]|nr:hypothetical protein [bacterium]